MLQLGQLWIPKWPVSINKKHCNAFSIVSHTRIILYEAFFATRQCVLRCTSNGSLLTRIRIIDWIWPWARDYAIICAASRLPRDHWLILLTYSATRVRRRVISQSLSIYSAFRSDVPVHRHYVEHGNGCVSYPYHRESNHKCYHH